MKKLPKSNDLQSSTTSSIAGTAHWGTVSANGKIFLRGAGAWKVERKGVGHYRVRYGTRLKQKPVVALTIQEDIQASITAPNVNRNWFRVRVFESYTRRKGVDSAFAFALMA